MKSFDTWKRCISSTAGSLVTNSLNEINLGGGNIKVDGFNSSQIGSISSLNSTIGSLASTAVTYGLTGEATFNVLNISDFGAKGSSGLLEVTLGGKKGFSSRIGTGGADVSRGSLMTALAGINNLKMNEKIKKAAANNNMENAATALRMQYGFGDEKQMKQLDDILNGKASIKAGDGKGDAQTIDENGKRVVYLNKYKENMTREEKLAMGITLGHEAYRDGIVGDAQSQFNETVGAVFGHTAMAKRLQNDGAYEKIMKGIVSGNQNLKDDIDVLDYALRTNDWDGYASYVEGTYDSSADYWKLMDDGTIKYNGNYLLRDEKGNIIYIPKSKGKEGSLVEILYGKNASKEDIDDVRKIMSENFDHYVENGKDENNMDNWYWNMDSNLNKPGIDGSTVFERFGGSIVTQAFISHYDSTVDALIADFTGKDIGDITLQGVTDSASERFGDLLQAKFDFYNSIQPLVNNDSTKITGDYKDSIYNKDGTVNTEYYINYGNKHYGIDIGKESSNVDITGSDIFMAISGKVTDNYWDSRAGWSVHTNYGYYFEKTFISTGLHGEYDHMQNPSPLMKNQYYSSNTVVGQVGNTGAASQGAHLHYTIYSIPNSYYSDSTARYLLGKDYLSTAMTNTPNTKTVYDPTNFYNTYKRRK